MSKLTLSVDEKVVRQAKLYAARHGTSVSKLVERFLDALSRQKQETPETPVLLQLRGALSKGDERDYRRYLVRKYR